MRISNHFQQQFYSRFNCSWREFYNNNKSMSIKWVKSSSDTDNIVLQRKYKRYPNTKYIVIEEFNMAIVVDNNVMISVLFLDGSFGY